MGAGEPARGSGAARRPGRGSWRAEAWELARAEGWSGAQAWERERAGPARGGAARSGGAGAAGAWSGCGI